MVNMKKPGVIIASVIVMGFGLFLFWHEERPQLTLYRQYVEGLTLPDQPTSNGVPKLVIAVKHYARDHVSSGQSLPATVTLGDLVSGGYISTNDVRDLHFVDLTIYPLAGNRDPKAVLVRWRMADGRETVVLADGTLQ